MCILKGIYLIFIESWLPIRFTKRCFTFWKKEDDIALFILQILSNTYKILCMVILGIIVNISFERYHAEIDFVQKVIIKNCIDAEATDLFKRMEKGISIDLLNTIWAFWLLYWFYETNLITLYYKILKKICCKTCCISKKSKKYDDN